ncbi:acyl-protein thioesterase 1-like [Tropilaelaps mercedesae]|uniref:palmitoyl-protein hydrolase n=1 Tax=Tropilaelaps mercedesae TaxID=418985 RepID=A0A1V9XIJ7_9ACAR|nr:acyl-protein thioesterase 1-like [Tropilaelaps mercedesae]
MGGQGSKMSAPIIIPATARHTATVIFLHGLGDTGYGWSEQLRQLRLPHVKYICPNAPAIPVALNGGMRMPAWFNIFSLDANGPQDEQGIKNATANVHKMIKDEESAGIASNRIIIGGFSMGGALALYAGCTHPTKLAGVIGLSTWLPMPDAVEKATTTNRDTHIYIGHGDCDDLIYLRWGLMSSEHLQKFNPNVVFKTYSGMGHSSCSDEMIDMANFIKDRLPAQ